MPRKLPDLLQAYAEFTQDSDSPQVFHAWIALGTIAGAAQRKIFMRAKTFWVLSNMFIILTSPPGRAKKGAALNVGKGFLKEVTPKVNFASESGSPEALMKTIAAIQNPAHQSMTAFSMEFGTLMNTRPGEMVDFLTDIWDGNADFSRNTLSGGVLELKRPWLSIMAGTTPQWLGEKMGLLALQGGLVARSIFPYSEERSLENSWPEMDTEAESLKSAIVHDLSHISAQEGEFKFDGGRDGEAFRWYDAWYQDKDNDNYRKNFSAVEGTGYKSRFPLVDDPRTATYFDRKHVHILKVAMMFSLSYKDEKALSLEDLRRALAILNATEAGMRKALSSAGKNEDANTLQDIYRQIRLQKKISYRDLLTENYHNLKYGQKSLDDILSALERMKRIARNNGVVEFVEQAPAN